MMLYYKLASRQALILHDALLEQQDSWQPERQLYRQAYGYFWN